MTQQIKRTTRGLSRRTVLISALVALVLSIIMNGYFYSLEGARGLYVWHPLLALKVLLFMGLGPISLAIVALPLEKLAKKWAMRMVRWCSFIGSILVSVASIALLAFLIIVPRVGPLEPARLDLINPSQGIQSQEVQMEAGFSAGGVKDSATQSPEAEDAPGALSPLDRPLLRLSFSSDPHWGADTANATARTQVLEGIAASKPDAFFMLGDTVETGNSATQWNLALSDLEALIPNVPLRPILGNHDALFGGQYLYRKAFYPKDFSSDSGSPYYWSINTGSATIVAVDLPWGTEMFGARQKAWLEKTLAAADPRRPLIVVSHSYFYASGYDDPDFGTPWYDHYQNIPALVPLFEKYGVDLVISGHNHYQELLSHNGVTYAIVGSMGGLPDPEPSHHSPYSKWIDVGGHGWLDVSVLPGRLALTFRSEMGEARQRATVGY
jgi:hypothetical protein